MDYETIIVNVIPYILSTSDKISTIILKCVNVSNGVNLICVVLSKTSKSVFTLQIA